MAEPILKNLNAVQKAAKNRYKNEFVWQEIVLSENFKLAYRKYLNDKGGDVVYFTNTSIVTTKQGQYIFVANQGFAIASYMVDFCTELLTYRELFLKICDYLGYDSYNYAKKLKSGLYSPEQEQEFKDAARAILDLSFSGYSDIWESADYLWRFASDYSWWSGSKTIDRHDFYVSPVLNLLDVVHASHEYVSEIIKAFASVYKLRLMVNRLEQFTVGSVTKNWDAKETVEVIPVEKPASEVSKTEDTVKESCTISISAASLERFRAGIV